MWINDVFLRILANFSTYQIMDIQKDSLSLDLGKDRYIIIFIISLFLSMTYPLREYQNHIPKWSFRSDSRNIIMWNSS